MAKTVKRTSKEGREPKKPSVIISGMPSVGKTTAANVISEKFRLDHLAGGDMLKEIAVEHGYQPSGPDWWDGDEGMKFLKERKSKTNFDREVDRRLVERIRSGGVVVTSYPVPWLCKEGLKLWFDASPRTRARRLATRDSIRFRDALKIIRERDMKNMKLYSVLYKIEFGKDLSVFNYVIDTEHLSAAEVASAALKIVSDTFPLPDRRLTRRRPIEVSA